MKTLMLAMGLLPGIALACGPDAKPVFACTTTKGKSVEVCQGRDAITYRYGAKGAKPELEISERNDQFLWQGDGGSGMETAELTFVNGNTQYVIFYTNEYDHTEADGSETLGIDGATLTVSRAGKDLATLECRSKGLMLDAEPIKAERRPYVNAAD